MSRRRLGLILLVLLVLVGAFAERAAAASPNVVISQVYGGGGNSGSTYKNDFIELFNRSASAVDISTWSVQYASATGTSWSKTNLTGSIAPGGYYLIQEAPGAGGTTSLPSPDAIGSIAMSATVGKVALMPNQTTNTGSCPSIITSVDLVGYGTTSNCFEGVNPAPAPSNTTADLRNGNGCQDSDINSADFAVGAPTPRNSLSPYTYCSSTNPAGTGAATPATVPAGGSTLLTVAVTPGTGPASAGLAVAGDLSTIGGTVTQMFYNDATHGDAVAGDNIFSFQANVSVGTSGGAKSLPFTVSDAQARSSSGAILLTVLGATPPTASGSATPASVDRGATTLLTVAVTPGANPTSTGIAVTADLSAIGGGSSQQLYDDGTNGDLTAGDSTFSYIATVAASTSAGGKTLPVGVSDAQGRTGSTSISLSVTNPPVAIHDIQGATHISPLNGQSVTTTGIVTAKKSNGYYLETPQAGWDGDTATSEGILVFTSSAPASVSVGDSVRVSGTVSEFRSGGAASANLTTTELGSPATSVLATGNPLPAPEVVGAGGRTPPDTVIEDDAGGNVETGGAFDPATDGIDFWESLEGMRAQLNDAVATGRTNRFGELTVVGDNGASASVRTARGGLVIRPSDFNPERITLDDLITPLPAANVGDSFPGATLGVIDYGFGLPVLEVTSIPVLHSGGLAQEVAAAAGTNQLAVATFNVENLDPGDGPDKFNRLAQVLVDNLRAPDIVALEEVQDNDGAANTGTVDATVTLNTLVSAVQAAGGPTYSYRLINPVNNQDGGEPGGNIRVVYFFRTDRGLTFVDRSGAGSTTPNSVTGSGSATQLAYSPGRIDPASTAFNSSRKPLAAEFMYHGHHVFAIANHFNSKGGDQPLFGRFQPPMRSSETQRHQQAQIVHDFVAQIEGADPSADVVVLGDLNDFEFSDTVSILKAGVLNTLIDTLPQNERYTYVFDGNSQAIDHILLSNHAFGLPFAYDVVHVNSEFASQVSDHEPQEVLLTLNSAPTASAGGPYTVAEGSSTPLAGSGTDLEGGPLTYEWDLNNDGTFETSGQNPTFSAAGLDGPSDHPVTLRVTDDGGLTATSTATVHVTNVAPTAHITGAPGSSPEGTAITLGSSVTDPGTPDTFTYAWTVTKNGSPYAAGTGASITFTPDDNGSYVASLVVTDDDGGVSTPDSVTIAVTNIAPTATFTATPSVYAGFPIALALTSPHDPSSADTTAGFTYSFDCGSGPSAFGPSPTASCPTTDTGPRTVSGTIRDKDGGSTTYSATVQVIVTADSLCQLTTSWAKNKGVANSLCTKLSKGNYDAYANEVRAQTGDQPGKSFTPEQGALLLRLVGQL